MKQTRYLDAPKKDILLRNVILEIVKRIRPEQVFLMSAEICCRQEEDILLDETRQVLYGSRYQLLVLYKQERWKYNLKDEILLRRHFVHVGNPEIYLMDIRDFDQRLETGDDFYLQLLPRLMLWYQREENQNLSSSK